jgi:hypothetical protein
MSDRWCNATTVLKPQTLMNLEANLSRQGTNLVDGWAATNPLQVQQWEADGTLLQHAQEAQELGNQAQESANRDGVSHLSSAEVNEIYGGPSNKL